MNTEPAALRPVYLKPGELLVTSEACEVITVLGSCVAVTMFNLRFRYAAICHGMLPGPIPMGSNPPQNAERYKYLSEAIPMMADKYRRLGVLAREVEVKMFGGGNVIGQFEDRDSARWIGSVNVEAAKVLLEAVSMSIKSGCVGGNLGRKILFNTNTGEVLHRYL